MSNEEMVLAAIRRNPGKDDDELSEMTGIKPRQQVNQICHRLKGQHLISREMGARKKIVNQPI